MYQRPASYIGVRYTAKTTCTRTQFPESVDIHPMASSRRRDTGGEIVMVSSRVCCLAVACCCHHTVTSHRGLLLFFILALHIRTRLHHEDPGAGSVGVLWW